MRFCRRHMAQSPVYYVIGVFTALLTAFYMFRLYARRLWVGFAELMIRSMTEEGPGEDPTKVTREAHCMKARRR